MRGHVKVRRQRPIQGGRLRGSHGFDPHIYRAVEKEAQRFNCSIPFVLSVMAADALGIELEKQDRYTIRPKADITLMRRA